MAAIYVGTYGKYANGSIFGKWLELEDYETAEDFYKECRRLHKDEHDPEFMFQDWEGIPAGMEGEWMDVQKILDYLHEFSEEERKIIEEYREEIDSTAEPRAIIEAYVGEMRGEELAEQIVEECGDLRKIPVWLSCHIDWVGVWRDLSYDGYAETTNYVFYPI